MNTKSILANRLAAQGLSKPLFKKPEEVVSWLGAVQAQDYHGAKWGIATRVPGTTDADIEQAIAERTIVRSWSLRGTLHFMSPDDIRWILQIPAARISSLYSSYYKK